MADTNQQAVATRLVSWFEYMASTARQALRDAAAIAETDEDMVASIMLDEVHPVHIIASAWHEMTIAARAVGLPGARIMPIEEVVEALADEYVKLKTARTEPQLFIAAAAELRGRWMSLRQGRLDQLIESDDTPLNVALLLEQAQLAVDEMCSTLHAIRDADQVVLCRIGWDAQTRDWALRTWIGHREEKLISLRLVQQLVMPLLEGLCFTLTAVDVQQQPAVGQQQAIEIVRRFVGEVLGESGPLAAGRSSAGCSPAEEEDVRCKGGGAAGKGSISTASAGAEAAAAEAAAAAAGAEKEAEYG